MRIINTYTSYRPPAPKLSADDIERICCASVPVDECSEVGKITPYESAEQDDFGFDPEQELRDAQQDEQKKKDMGLPSKKILSVQLAPVGGPKSGKPCGEKHESWKGSLNCCDEVEPLYFDDDQTADVLPAGGSIYLFASGGLPPYTFTTTSNATSFPDGRKTWTTDYPVALLGAGPTFCGLTAVSVTDGCTTDTVEIRSDLGSWYPIGNSCVLPGAAATYIGIGGVGYWRAEAISGRYKQVESQKWSLWNGMQGGMAWGCAETSQGNCATGYHCEPCGENPDAQRNAFFLSCLPSTIGWPCLAARSDAGVRAQINGTSWPIVADLINAGQQWVWLSDYGLSYGICGASISHYWNLGWVDKGPSEPEVYEWGC